MLDFKCINSCIAIWRHLKYNINSEGKNIQRVQKSSKKLRLCIWFPDFLSPQARKIAVGWLLLSSTIFDLLCVYGKKHRLYLTQLNLLSVQTFQVIFSHLIFSMFVNSFFSFCYVCIYILPPKCKIILCYLAYLYPAATRGESSSIYYNKAQEVKTIST